MGPLPSLSFTVTFTTSCGGAAAELALGGGNNRGVHRLRCSWCKVLAILGRSERKIREALPHGATMCRLAICLIFFTMLVAVVVVMGMVVVFEVVIARWCFRGFGWCPAPFAAAGESNTLLFT